MAAYVLLGVYRPGPNVQGERFVATPDLVRRCHARADPKGLIYVGSVRANRGTVITSQSVLCIWVSSKKLPVFTTKTAAQFDWSAAADNPCGTNGIKARMAARAFVIKIGVDAIGDLSVN